MTVQRVPQDLPYFGNHWRKQPDLYYHHVSELMEFYVFLVLCTEAIHVLWHNLVPQCMDHVPEEDISIYWTMIMPTVLSVIFGLPLPLHGQTDVTHGPHRMLLMTSSEVDVIL